MREAIRVILFLSLFAIIYSISWYIVAISLCTNINQLLKDNDKKITIDFLREPVSFSLDKVLPYGFPLKMGVKFINLEEESTDNFTNQKYLTSHKGLVTLTYDFIKGGFVFSNTGESLVKLRPLASGFGVKVNSDNSYFVKIPWSAKLIQAFRGGIEVFELINFVERVDVKATKVKAYDLVNDAMIFDQDVSEISFSWQNAQYYKNLEDLNSNIPKNYNLKINTVINEAAGNKKIIAPPSFVYFLLHKMIFTANVDVNFDTKANKSDINEVLNNSSITFKRFDFSTPLLKANFIGGLSAESFEVGKNYTFDGNLDLTLDKLENIEPYLISLNSLLQKEHSVYLFKDDKKLGDLLNGPCSFKLNTAGSYSFNKKLKNLSLESFYFMLNDNFGFNVRGQSSFASIRDWYLEAGILVYNFAQMIDKTADFLVKYQDYDPSVVNGAKESVKLLLRGVSSNPASDSKDLALDLQFSHNINASKIGNIPLKFFLENYNKTLQSAN
jgi:hypothetical protein